MEKKEFYKHRLPHFQQPGQAYFVTWCIKDAVPQKALVRYSKELELLQHQLSISGAASRLLSGYNRRNKSSRLQTETPSSASNPELDKLKKAYYLTRKKYIKAYDDLLDTSHHSAIDLSKPTNRQILIDTLQYWNEKKLKNIAFTIMPNHVHWVFELKEKDENGKAVFLQDVLHSVKRQSARLVNKAENRLGTLWQKESFDTTIRDEKHLYYAIRYVLSNPVKAGLINDWHKWEGTWCEKGYGDFGCGVPIAIGM